MIPLTLHNEFTSPPDALGDIDAWRAYRDQIERSLEQLNEILAEADRLEVERLQARLEKLQGRRPEPASTIIATTTKIERPPQPKRPEIDKDGIVRPPSYSETDAGHGVGSREPPMSGPDFRAELADLGERTAVKRLKQRLS